MSRGFTWIKEYAEVGKDRSLPQRKTLSSAGYDIAAATTTHIPAGKTVLVPTGLKAWMESDEVLLLTIRSSKAVQKHLMLSNAVGVIDAGGGIFDANQKGIHDFPADGAAGFQLGIDALGSSTANGYDIGRLEGPLVAVPFAHQVPGAVMGIEPDLIIAGGNTGEGIISITVGSYYSHMLMIQGIYIDIHIGDAVIASVGDPAGYTNKDKIGGDAHISRHIGNG